MSMPSDPNFDPASDPTFDLHRFLPFLMHHASEKISLGFREIYRNRYRMTRTEWRVLANLGQYGRQTASDIITRTGLHKTKVSRAVFSIEQRRWLKRDQDDKDRRTQFLALTKQGENAFRELSNAGIAHDREMRKRLGARDYDRLIDLLEKVRNL
jgi:DNA-binding MarR family transcriptional regulator